MKTETTATVVEGALELDTPLSLPNQSRVRVAVEPLENWRTTFKAGLEAWKAYLNSIPSIPVGGTLLGMSCMNAVDTNILVYFVDADEPTKRTQAVKLLDHLVNEPVETVLLASSVE